MFQKRKTKRLSLNKETIAQLSQSQLREVKGGAEGFLSIWGKSCKPEKCTFIGSEVEPCTHSAGGNSCMVCNVL